MSEEDRIEKIIFAISDHANALEAAAVNLRNNMKELMKFPEWDPNKIKWEDTEGSRGPYQRSDDVNNLQFKAMLRDLAAHNGKMRREGYFYWVFQRGDAIGRKRVK